MRFTAVLISVTTDVTINTVSEAGTPAVSYTSKPFQTADREQPQTHDVREGRHERPEAEKEEGRGVTAPL